MPSSEGGSGWEKAGARHNDSFSFPKNEYPLSRSEYILGFNWMLFKRLFLNLREILPKRRNIYIKIEHLFHNYGKIRRQGLKDIGSVEGTR